MSRLNTEQEAKLARLRDWKRQLYGLFTEMENVNGDPPQGTNPAKLECLTRFAWEAAVDEVEHMEGRR